VHHVDDVLLLLLRVQVGVVHGRFLSVEERLMVRC
jgi:hypothetical protein